MPEPLYCAMRERCYRSARQQTGATVIRGHRCGENPANRPPMWVVARAHAGEPTGLARYLVDTGVDADLHATGADASLCYADDVVQPAVALVIGLEPTDQVLPSRLVAFEDRPPTELEQDGCPIVGR